ncbi:MAG: taurine dioxygenase [Gammaproteobacteria bacterium]|jgi:taurine dioxygenase
MNIQPMGPILGAQITDVELGSLSDNDFNAIRDALGTHEVLVFPGQVIETDDQIAFARRFGELSVSPFSPNSDEVAELIVLDNHPGNASPLTDIWHSDETFREAPPMTTILRARIVPEFGGNTMFASMTAAYEGLSDRMKTYLSGLTALHGFGRFGEMLRVDPERRSLLHRVENELPMPHHPVVTVHPGTARKVLFVNPHFTLKIDDVPEEESRAILDFLFRRALMPEYQLRVHWAPDTVVMWDNRSVQHYAPNDYQPHRRRMERVTVKGIRPVGDVAVMDFDAKMRGIAARNVGESFGADGSEAPATRQFNR